MAFHAFGTLWPGGFIGVDVFFVISGFVITQSLLAELQRTSTIDLIAFWCRRIRRILPASTLVLCAIALCTGLMPDLDNRAIGKDLISAALFFVNLRFAARATEYIAADHSDNPLLHFWSLSVEEQFYAVWPAALILIIALTKGRNAHTRNRIILFAIAAALVASFAFSIFLTSSKPAVAFFNPLSRGWQLLAGGLLAAALPLCPTPSKTLATVLSLIGLCALAGFGHLYAPTMLYPGWLALVPIGAAGLLIGAGLNAQTPFFHILASAPLRLIGRLSFSWYLWHWPVLIFGHLIFGQSTAATWLLIAASFALAAATYRWIENPIRYAQALRASKWRGIALGLALVAIGAGSGAALRQFGFDNLPLGNGVFVSREGVKRDRPAIYDDRCLRGFADGNDKICAYGAAQGPSVVLFGDSHAGHWFEPLKMAAEKQGWRLYVRIKASCQPVDAPQKVFDSGRNRDYAECSTWQRSVQNELAALKPALIIIGGTTHGFPIEDEKRMLDRFAAIAPTLVVAGTPLLPQEPIECLKSTGPIDCQWPLASVTPKRQFPITPRDQLPPRLEIIDLNGRICPDGVCRPVTANRVLMFDKHHLTASFSRTFEKDFEAILERYRPR